MPKKTSRLTHKIKCLILVRISTIKQFQESDSPEVQIERGRAYAKSRFGYDDDQIIIIEEAQSGRKEDRPQLDQAFLMVESLRIERLLVYDIDRLTRAGAGHYEQIKRRLAAYGCEIVDTKGVIQPARNTLEGTGGAFGADFEYDWSVFSASEKAEIIEAQMAKDEARKILSRTIPVMIRNAQQGRTNRGAPYGYRNIKIIDESGKPQPSKEINEEEAFYLRRLYEGAAAGQDLGSLCDKLNQLGFKSRYRKKWSADKSRVIGKIGGNPLTPSDARELLERSISAGFILEKWTNGWPVRANHDGVVSIELWNAANRRRWRLERSEASPTGWALVKITERVKKHTHMLQRPDFPFKQFIKCPTCGKQITAGKSKSRNGSKIGYYFCSRGHKTVSMNSDAFHRHLRSWLSEMRFEEALSERFEAHIRALWAEKLGGLNRRLLHMEREAAALRDEADAIFEKIKIARSPGIIERLERGYEEIEAQLANLKSNRQEGELSERDLNRVIRWARHLFEHLDELIMDADDEGLRAIFWELVFPKTPPLDELRFRTAETSPLVRLKAPLEDAKTSLVGQTGFGSNQIIQELSRWAQRLLPLAERIDRALDAMLYGEDETQPQAA